MPVYQTELGWAATPSGAGAGHAIDGPTSQESRAGTISLVSESLALSDCNVRS